MSKELEPIRTNNVENNEPVNYLDLIRNDPIVLKRIATEQKQFNEASLKARAKHGNNLIEEKHLAARFAQLTFEILGDTEIKLQETCQKLQQKDVEIAVLKKKLNENDNQDNQDLQKLCKNTTLPELTLLPEQQMKRIKKILYQKLAQKIKRNLSL